MSRLADAIKDAVTHFAEKGYGSPHEVRDWMGRLETAAYDPAEEHDQVTRITHAMEGAFRRFLGRGAIRRAHPKIEEWSVQRLEPQLRDELQRRIWASAQLIKLNRAQAVGKVLARFSGFATSVPPNGFPSDEKGRQRVTRAQLIREKAREIVAPTKSLDFITRRAQVDQSGKLAGNLNDIVAQGGGAIASRWDHVPEIERQFRPEHTARHGKTYPIRNSWADDRGYLRAPYGYWQDHEIPGQLINCQCEAVYLYHIDEVPDENLTGAGLAAKARQE